MYGPMKLLLLQGISYNMTKACIDRDKFVWDSANAEVMLRYLIRR